MGCYRVAGLASPATTPLERSNVQLLWRLVTENACAIFPAATVELTLHGCTAAQLYTAVEVCTLMNAMHERHAPEVSPRWDHFYCTVSAPNIGPLQTLDLRPQQKIPS